MKLKQLVLQGYKTFASKTEFVFDEGITAIVGPNGSGKSNVADAVRWVLGEQSYSMLRGKRTADMIFTGSRSRSRAGMAQAILTLDNSDGWLPIDYTEVEIGRRAFHTGENEYLLNGQKVRLKDITDLLAQSGLSQRTYTIIGQGLIDQALSLRADERRALFEEAAGINHYKIKRATALRQLSETQRNLERVHDILAEIRPRLNSLKRQATRARNFEQVSADLHHLLRIWYGYKWEQAKEKLGLARVTAESTSSVWQQSRQRLLVQQENQNDLRRRINRRQQQSEELITQRDESRSRLEGVRREVAILEERHKSLAQQLEDVAQDMPVLAGQRDEAAVSLDAAAAELATAQTGLQKAQQEQDQFGESFALQQLKIKEGQQALAAAAQTQRKNQQRLAQAEGQLSQLQERLRELQQLRDDAGAGVAKESNGSLSSEQLNQQIGLLTLQLTAARTEESDLRQQRAEYQQRRQQLAQTLKKVRREYAHQNREVTRRQQAVARQETRTEMLDHLRAGTVTLQDDDGVLGRLASFLSIPPEMEKAISAALTDRLATLLVQDQEILWQLAAGDPSQQIVAAVASEQPPSSSFSEPEDPAVIGWASRHIQVQEPAQSLARFLLDPVLLVKDRPSAYRLGVNLPVGSLAVAPDGFVVHAGGVVVVGGRDQAKHLLQVEADWRESAEKLAEEQSRLLDAENALQAFNNQIQQLQDDIEREQDEERGLVQTFQEAAAHSAGRQRELDKAQQQLAFQKRQQEREAAQVKAQEQEISRLQGRLDRLHRDIASFAKAAASDETAVVEARQRIDSLPVAAAQQQRQTLQQSVAAANTIVAGRQAVVDSRRTTLVQLEKQLSRLRQRQESLQSQQAEADIAAKQEEQQQLRDQVEKLELSLHPAQAQLGEYRREMRQLEEEMASIQRRTLDLETQYTQAQVKLSQEENNVESLQERIKADLGLVTLTYDDEQTGPTPLPMGEDFIEELPVVSELPEDIDTTIHHHRGQLQRMGAINPDAPVEYENTQQRFDFLTQQVADLEIAERELRAVIAELDELTSKAFSATVTEVNAVFGHTFEQLFGGGSARLELTDPDDLTHSGVDIIARLPNRREQGLGLLSGGERSLTASALIFSLLKVSPTPFCVMDEVDAALDEANINRFRELLRELSLNTQFVVITHNRGTVQAAQTIYGISMGNDSASLCISIKPEEYLKQAELL